MKNPKRNVSNRWEKRCSHTPTPTHKLISARTLFIGARLLLLPITCASTSLFNAIARTVLLSSPRQARRGQTLQAHRPRPRTKACTATHGHGRATAVKKCRKTLTAYYYYYSSPARLCATCAAAKSSRRPGSRQVPRSVSEKIIFLFRSCV